MIEIKNLTKRFGTTTVLEDISMTLQPGFIHAFVGRNGSGKTMLMKHILGFVQPSDGFVAIDVFGIIITASIFSRFWGNSRKNIIKEIER